MIARLAASTNIQRTLRKMPLTARTQWALGTILWPMRGTWKGVPYPTRRRADGRFPDATGLYEPMSFGPLGRNFASRYPLAGHHDQNWIDSKAPFWPDDFDYRYFQAAPLEQQIPYPSGGEHVYLSNLTPAGAVAWQLPATRMRFAVVRRNKDPELRDGVVDTLVIDSDLGRFSMTWRMVLPLKRDCFEIAQVIAGR